MRVRNAIGSAVFLLVFAGHSRRARAQAVDDSSSPAPTAAAPPVTAPTSPPLGVVANGGSRGFGFVSADGADSVVVHWLVQADYTTFIGDKPPGVETRDTFTMGFAGLQLDATLARIFRASFLTDFSQSRLTLLDAFVEARVDPAFVVRVGKFPTPISEERLTPKFFLPWISTGPSSFLLPVRELGAQVYGDFGHGILQYNAALVNGSYAGAITDNDFDSYKDVMGRVFAHPFKTTAIAPLVKLGLGIGASAGDRVGSPGTPQTPVLRTYGNVPFFSYKNDGTPAGTVVARGEVARIAPHLTWAWGPVAGFADYVHEVDHFGATAVQSDAFGATLAVAVTGEDSEPFARIVVKRPIDPRRGHFGGMQLVAGGGSIATSSAAFSANLADPRLSMQRARILGGGINWYPINGVGVLVDYSHTAFDAYGNAIARGAEDTIYGRFEMHL